MLVKTVYLVFSMADLYLEITFSECMQILLDNKQVSNVIQTLENTYVIFGHKHRVLNK